MVLLQKALCKDTQRFLCLTFTSRFGYYIRHQQEVESYLNERGQLAESVRQRFSEIQSDLNLIRARLLAQQILFSRYTASPRLGQ